METRISIVIPCYKASGTISRCLDSLLSQSVPVEIIVVEDCSEDQTLDVLKGYFAKHQDIKYKLKSHEVNQGVSISRNDGIAMATSDYVLFVDADDELEATCCQKLLEEADKHAADIICCNALHVYSDGKTRPYFTPMHKLLLFTGREYQQKCLCQSLMDCCFAKLFRRDYLVKNNFSFDGAMRFAEDTLFTNLAVLHSESIIVISDYFGYYYHDNPVSCVNTIALQNRLDNLKLLLYKMRENLPSNEDLLLLRKAAEYLWSIRKFGGKKRSVFIEKLCQSSLWFEILFPVIKRHGKLRHRLVAKLLSYGCLRAIAFW